MAEASAFENFFNRCKEFELARQAGDAYKIAEIGSDIINRAVEELAKPNGFSGTKDKYRDEAIKVAAWMAQFIRSGGGVKTVASGGSQDTNEGEGGTDPYYQAKQWFSDEAPALGLKDIVGLQEVKDAFIVDVVAPLKAKYKSVYRKFRGEQMGSQILLYGPPGTGKTHIVKCLAGALKCKIAVVQTSEVLASIVGVAEKNIRDVFAQAAELDKCIIFLDEIDSLCSDRSSIDSRNTKTVLTTLLTCMDGFLKNTRPGQLRIVIAATNLPWRLDSALKRGGRFETQIYVPLPDAEARDTFVRTKLEALPHDGNVTVEYLANRLAGYSGADILAVMRQIANRPLRRAVVKISGGDTEGAEAERITLDDCDAVLNTYINSVNAQMLINFEAYDRNMSPDDLMKPYLAKGLNTYEAIYRAILEDKKKK